ncbi:putative chitin synthase activator [Rosellinia necatrix]|uniref:Putative chitin synthase activator n=1 Tax=Rosellinia necatrix TaxID=77044 RepID=A0A1S7UP34_ROSNE|nr:putative chitin synthase activator [Rosellinia necatrix]
MPQFGATFYPGGVDDYLMPEVLAPLPQRVMPEVPENMQQGLQRMELEAREVGRNTTNPNGAASGTRHHREPSLSNVINTQSANYGQQYQPGRPKPADYSPASNFSPFQEHDTNTQFEKSLRAMNDFPSFSHFPRVTGEHIPPSDEEKETVLANSREHVLHSNDPDMQICWARDVLSYVEIAAEAAMREVEAARNSNDRELPARPATPKIEHELRVDAINIISYLAEQDHPEALFIKSKWLEFGKFGRRPDKKEAYSGYMRAAQQGWGRADYRIGMLYENSNDMEKAMRHYQSGLANKDSAAAYRLGMINLLGQRGMPRDIARGLDLIHQAADSADEDAPQGAFVYGMLIARDLPDVVVPDGILPYDVAVARQFIEKAAYHGFAKAQLKMGQAYELCQLGCEFKPAYSLHYYGLAARQGQPEACLGVSRWFLFGYEEDFAKNEQLAFKYAQMAAKTKLATGEFAMGYYHEIGISVEKDIREARKWYELAAEHGNKDAVARLEGLSQAKALSKEDHETATLTRIKSKHGSQRGQRPERFKQMNSTMPTVSEAQASPRISPQPSPRSQGFNHADYPEPSQHSPGMNSGRQPAFGINLGGDRNQSAVPYPEDDRPAPLNLNRQGTNTPYPEDDVTGYKPQLTPHYNPGIRTSSGHGPDRPPAAFGINTGGPGGMRTHSGGQLPIPPAGMDPNYARPGSGGYQAQGPGGYRQPQDPRSQGADYNQRPPSSHYDRPGGGLPGQPGPNRLTKMAQPMGGAGRGAPLPPHPGYGKRESSLPPSHAPGPRMSSAGAPGGPPAMAGGLGPRVGSVPPGGLPQGGPRPNSGGRPGPGPGSSMPPKDRPPPMDLGGRSSAPPPAQGWSSPGLGPSTPTSTASAPSKPVKTGPATFEQMGIPQAKQNDDCVVM